MSNGKLKGCSVFHRRELHFYSESRWILRVTLYCIFSIPPFHSAPNGKRKITAMFPSLSFFRINSYKSQWARNTCSWRNSHKVLRKHCGEGISCEFTVNDMSLPNNMCSDCLKEIEITYACSCHQSKVYWYDMSLVFQWSMIL